MKTYVAIIGSQAVLAFRAEDDEQAQEMLEDHEGDVRSELHELSGPDGKPLWDGKSAIDVKEASPAQHADWKQARDEAISEGEIDLDAGDNPDEWTVYLSDLPGMKKS